MSVEEVIGRVKKTFGIEEEGRTSFQPEGSDIHKWLGTDPHAKFEQCQPSVNKEEPAAFANPVEAGAKRPSEAVCGLPMPGAMPDDIQAASAYACPADARTRLGSDPHADFEQCQPAVNKVEPAGFANPCEAGAKKPSEAQMGKPMPKPQTFCQ
jgi:hypothetical protein